MLTTMLSVLLFAASGAGAQSPGTPASPTAGASAPSAAIAALTATPVASHATVAAPQATPPAQTPPAAPAAPDAPAPSQTEPAFVIFTTDKGDIALELYPDKAPISVKNFLEYVDSGFYNGTVFHRSVPGFVIQGGGFDANFTQKATRAPIRNEATNGLLNTRGSISMARTPHPDSATSQFFLNLKDNKALDATGPGTGYAVFGTIIRGQDVMDAIAAIPTQERVMVVSNGQSARMPDVPSETVTITKARRATAEEAKSSSGAAAPDKKPADKAPAAPPSGGGSAPR